MIALCFWLACLCLFCKGKALYQAHNTIIRGNIMETSKLLAQELADSDYGYLSVSHGTLRSQDLLPAFLSTLDTYRNPSDTEAADLVAQARQEVPQDAWNNDAHPYWNTEEAGYLINETLFDALNAICPEGCYYFGTLEGDASDFGFWPCMEE